MRGRCIEQRYDGEASVHRRTKAERYHKKPHFRRLFDRGAEIELGTWVPEHHSYDRPSPAAPAKPLYDPQRLAARRLTLVAISAAIAALAFAAVAGAYANARWKVVASSSDSSEFFAYASTRR